MGKRIPITIKLPEELIKKINETGLGKTATIERALEDYFTKKENRINNDNLSLIRKYEERIAVLERNNATLIRLLEQEQMLHARTQSRLQISESVEKSRRWWQFWRK